MEIHLDVFLPKEDQLKCIREAKGRVEQQLEDFNRDSRATYSYGIKSNRKARSYEQRIKDSYIGCVSEFLTSKILNIEWSQERRQYLNGSAKPDLICVYDGNLTGVEVQGTRRSDRVIVRPRDFQWKKDKILFAFTSLPKGPVVNFGYKFYHELEPMCKSHPSWLTAKNSNSPYYSVPIDMFDDNLEKFFKK